MQLRTQHIDLSRGPVLMGIVNLTPDSFSDGAHLYRGGRLDVSAAVDFALQLAEEEEATRKDRDAVSQEFEALSAKYVAMLKEKKQMHNEIEILRQELIELQQANAKLHSLKEILQRENNKLREDKFIWGQERDLLSDENETLSKERARLKTDLDELTSLLEAATAE